MSPTGAEWATFFAAVAAYLRAERVQRAVLGFAGRDQRRVKRDRWGDR